MSLFLHISEYRDLSVIIYTTDRSFLTESRKSTYIANPEVPMHKKILILLTGALTLSITSIPVLASDPPTDDGQYIWQDENGDYWYRNGSEDEYSKQDNDRFALR